MFVEEAAGLRKRVKKLLIDKDMDRQRHGVSAKLSVMLTEHLGRRVSSSQLAMALTGYRSGKSEVQILRGLIGLFS